MTIKRLQVVTFDEAVRNFPGMWVAIKDGKVIEARRTPDEVVLALHERDIQDAYVTRIPGEHDKELVGLG
ncbi:MAG: DUF5678 domain-containing protein [Egibacteraceae bacterium]